MPHCGKRAFIFFCLFNFQYAFLLFVSLGEISGRQTDWKLSSIFWFCFFLITDSIYTERYMGLPVATDNLENYNVRKKELLFFWSVFFFFSTPLFISLCSLVLSPWEEISLFLLSSHDCRIVLLEAVVSCVWIGMRQSLLAVWCGFSVVCWVCWVFFCLVMCFFLHWAPFGYFADCKTSCKNCFILITKKQICFKI